MEVTLFYGNVQCLKRLGKTRYTLFCFECEKWALTRGVVYSVFHHYVLCYFPDVSFPLYIIHSFLFAPGDGLVGPTGGREVT